ncbi:MAG: Single-stranded-DNA-specific exonuclease RecJ [candidate division WS6 bacterium OLB20]|uniref:Single-stranded-DNA-specific exonuclease RecJ n=1 Tax=candidate division WS6 bacterium OLB20 TaxID=1617426 RepID=A0A136LWC7_9BACT|nr:MAG: Single-stranded-DNA-specific exonuclease RecJ [candidate division WS6 bacterium OLB20]
MAYAQKQNLNVFLTADQSLLLAPAGLGEVEKAADLILAAVKAGTKIAVFGDYDVDGVCATSILFDFLYRKLGAEVVPYIPDRFDEGYGMNADALQDLADSGTGLVITVDCGIRDEGLVSKFAGRLEFVITDHHTLPPEGVPVSAAAVVHPGHPETPYPDATSAEQQ